MVSAHFIDFAPTLTVVDPPPASKPVSKLSSILTMLQKPSTPKSLLAVYCPSYNFSRQGGDLAIYPHGEPFTVPVLLSVILMNVKGNEWEKIQSSVSPEELEAYLKASSRP